MLPYKVTETIQAHRGGARAPTPNHVMNHPLNHIITHLPNHRANKEAAFRERVCQWRDQVNAATIATAATMGHPPQTPTKRTNHRPLADDDLRVTQTPITATTPAKRQLTEADKRLMWDALREKIEHTDGLAFEVEKCEIPILKEFAVVEGCFHRILHPSTRSPKRKGWIVIGRDEKVVDALVKDLMDKLRRKFMRETMAKDNSDNTTTVTS